MCGQGKSCDECSMGPCGPSVSDYVNPLYRLSDKKKKKKKKKLVRRKTK